LEEVKLNAEIQQRIHWSGYTSAYHLPTTPPQVKNFCGTEDVQEFPRLSQIRKK
jgi:hypothetical protein